MWFPSWHSSSYLQTKSSTAYSSVASVKFQSVTTQSVQSVTTLSGMIANLYGPVEGRRHDYALIVMSNLFQDLRQFSYGVNGPLLCLFGDPACPMTRHLQSPFSSAHLNQQQRNFNKSMSQVDECFVNLKQAKTLSCIMNYCTIWALNFMLKATKG